MRSSSVKNVFGVPCVSSGGSCVCSPFHRSDQTRIDVRWALATREGRYGCADTRYAEDALTMEALMKPANGSRQSILARHLRGRGSSHVGNRSATGWETGMHEHAILRILLKLRHQFHRSGYSTRSMGYLNGIAVYYAPFLHLLPGVSYADRL